MGNPKLNFKNYKQRGEWMEMCFTARASEEGLQVSNYGDSAPYDFIVEYSARCLRVQVKPTLHQSYGGRCCQVRGSNRKPYVDGSFDFAAIYLIPHDRWFIIPGPQIAGQTSVFFTPGLRNSKHGQYEEAWQLLRSAQLAPLTHLVRRERK